MGTCVVHLGNSKELGVTRAEEMHGDVKWAEVEIKEHEDKGVQYPRNVGRKGVAFLYEASPPDTKTSDSSARP